MIKYVLYSLILFCSCSSFSDKQFNMLEEAFFEWYKKNHLLDIKYKNINTFYSINANNQQLFNEYLEDLYRFELELSQIDEVKIGFENLVNFNIISDFIKTILFIYENQKYYYHNIDLLIYKSYFQLYNIVESTDIIMDEKIDLLLSAFVNIKNDLDYIENSQIKVLSDIGTFNMNSQLFINYLDYIPIKINANNELLDQIDKNLNDLKKKTFLFKKNIKTSLQDINNHKINFNKLFFENYLFEEKENFDYEKLKDDYNDYKIRLFNKCIILYKQQNDEPIWVDEDDTLNVINWVVENQINISNIKKNNIIDNYYISLEQIKQTASALNINIINDNLPSFSKKNKNHHLFYASHLYSYDDIILDDEWTKNFNIYSIHNNLMNDILLKFLYKKKYYNNNKLRYSIIDDSFVFALSNVINKTIINSSPYNDNDIYMIIHYLNIMREIVKANSQYDYFINKLDKKVILNNLKKYGFYNSIKSDEVYSNILLLKNNYFKNYLFYKSLKNKYTKKEINDILNNGYIPLQLVNDK